ncbi:hypothetical protein EV379_0893 [Microterricola gilva]|uniref:SIMPL domain-containing protein n=1 Tax=Microterricola gilva TaxID=393267 RepID=A0A4Q8AJC6_9MICO|nr:SIMPL domain-containing protein [Microterricola gilva]RZU64592.1 hypothetical protein EV379_0893 [Microterricola gilva]
MPTIITVSGEAELKHSPERATAQLSVGFEGPVRERVLASSTELHGAVSEELAALLADGGPVTAWSTEQLRVWGQRPWSQNGEQLPVVYHSAASVTATFADFAALSEWLGAASLREGVTVHGIDWALHEETTRELTHEAQQLAVGAALVKAENFAQSLGLGSLTPLALSDPGLLGDENSPMPMMAMADSVSLRSRGAAGGAQFSPEEIVVSAAVHARFSAS